MPKRMPSRTVTRREALRLLGAGAIGLLAGGVTGVLREPEASLDLAKQSWKQVTRLLEQPVARIGFFTDLHHSSTSPSYSTRYPQQARAKLADIVAGINSSGVNAVVCGGDLIDNAEGDRAGALADLATVAQTYAGIGSRQHLVLGNHDLNQLTKAEFREVTGMRSNYYAFEAGGAQCIILDACFTADDDSSHYEAGGFDYQQTFIPPAQRAWLESTLASVDKPTVVFCHQRLDNRGLPEHTVNNAEEVRAILEASGKVAGVVTGHAHRNARTTLSELDYFVMQAACEGAHPANAYALLTVYRRRIAVEGFGRQASYT